MTGGGLEIEGLSLAINDTPILTGIELAVGAGEIVGLVGESGSGKSMTALAAMGLPPSGARMSGSIRIDGADLLKLPERDLCAIRGSRIAMIFQEPMTALNPLQTIGRQVAETVRIHTGAGRRDAARIARQTLNRVGLDEAHFGLDRYPHDLSGGQRQRVVIAMAIALRPKILIADEPTTALDVTTQAQILDLLKRLVGEDGMGLMLITHDLAVVAGMADRIAIMQDGAIVETGDTVPLFRALRHPYTRRLFAASRHVPARAPGTRDMAGKALLEVRGLVRDYSLPRRLPFASGKRLRAVDHVSLRIFPGENVGLVGESGCGKSTLARAVLGLETPQAGSVLVDGQLFADADTTPSRALRRKIQVVFQDPYGSFNPRHRVDRLVTEPFHLLDEQPTGRDRTMRLEKALDDVGLSASDAGKFIHEFSGGQRQRLAIARALITQPALIILDEAVSALDVSIRARILDLLSDLSKRLSVSYLFISHDLAVVRAITDRVMIMRAGSIVEEGATEKVFTDPQNAYSRTLLAATPILETALRRREAQSSVQPITS